MISHYHDLWHQVHKIQHVLDSQVCHIQKSYATSKTLSVQLRVPGKSIHMVLGKGNHFEGIGFSAKAPIPEIRLRDRLLEYFRKNITSSTLTGIYLDGVDRIITIKYRKNKYEHFFSLFYLGRKCYMLHSYIDSSIDDDKVVHFCSWKNQRDSSELSQHTYMNHLEKFNEIGRSQIDKESDREAREFPVESIWGNEIKIAVGQGEKFQNKARKKIERKIHLIKGDLKQALKWQEIQNWVLSLANDTEELPEGKVKLYGVNFNFGFSKAFYEKREIVFARVKRLKKAQLFLKERLLRTETELANLVDAKTANEDFSRSNIEVEWPQTRSHKLLEFRSEEAQITFYTYNGVKYGIGHNAYSNDQLRSKHSKKDHWWFHLENGKSPHVIVMSNSLTDELIYRCALIMIENLRKQSPEMSSIDIIYTQVKNLKSVKGQAGKVLFKKEKKRRFYLEDIIKFLDNK